MKKSMMIFAAVAALFAAGCKKADGAIDSYCGSWETISLNKAGVEQAIAISQIEIEKKSSTKVQFNGNSGVNSFFGEAEVKDGKLSVSDKMGSTKMAGEPAAMEFEDLFLECLAGADKVEAAQNGEAIILKICNTKAESVLTFRKR